MWRRSTARATYKKTHWKESNLRRQYNDTVQWQPMSLDSRLAFAWKWRTWRSNLTIVRTVLEDIGGIFSASFRGVCLNNFPNMEDLFQMNIFMYHIDFVDRAMIGQLARSVNKHSKTVPLLGFNSHIRFVFDINVPFKVYRCPLRVTFFNRAPNVKRHLTSCS